MMSQKRNMIRSNQAQIKYLCQYMAEHPSFAAGEFSGTQGAAGIDRQWHQLKEALDELGPVRSVEQWKVCWRDQKRKARAEGAAVAKAHNATGNAAPMPELSDCAVIVLNTIGEEMAVGCGPMESPIGFTASTSGDVTFTSQIQHSPQPSTSTAAPHLVELPSSRPLRRSRARKTHPPDRFLKAQEEQIKVLKELVEEVRRSNVLREEHNNLILRQLSKEKDTN